jgi:hypothetical protein
VPRDGEPQWLPEDRQAALAWQAEQNIRCNRCGHPKDETMDPANVKRWGAEYRTCYACDAIARAQDRSTEGRGPVAHSQAVHWWAQLD